MPRKSPRRVGAYPAQVYVDDAFVMMEQLGAGPRQVRQEGLRSGNAIESSAQFLRYTCPGHDPRPGFHQLRNSLRSAHHVSVESDTLELRFQFRC